MATDPKSEIGYVSGNPQASRPHKVKATIATIPVATESFQGTVNHQGKIELPLFINICINNMQIIL